MKDDFHDQQRGQLVPKSSVVPLLPVKTSSRHRPRKKIHSARHELRRPVQHRLGRLAWQLTNRFLRMGSIGFLLFGAIAACYLTLRHSSDLRSIPWLPHTLDPMIKWVDHHGLLRNVPAYALLALPVMILYPARRMRARLIALLALFAAVLECLQLFIPSRFFGWEDIALSWVGLLITWGLTEGARWSRIRLRQIMSNAGQWTKRGI